MAPDNPYESPQQGVEDKSQTSRSRVRVGIFLYFAVVFFVILIEVGLPTYYGAEPSPLRIAAIVGILYALWIGQEWAIVLCVFSTGARGLFAVSMGLQHGPPLMTLVGIVYVGIAICFFKSESLNAFLKRNKEPPSESVRREDQ